MLVLLLNCLAFYYFMLRLNLAEKRKLRGMEAVKQNTCTLCCLQTQLTLLKVYCVFDRFWVIVKKINVAENFQPFL